MRSWLLLMQAWCAVSSVSTPFTPSCHRTGLVIQQQRDCCKAEGRHCCSVCCHGALAAVGLPNCSKIETFVVLGPSMLIQVVFAWSRASGSGLCNMEYTICQAMSASMQCVEAARLVSGTGGDTPRLPPQVLATIRVDCCSCR